MNCRQAKTEIALCVGEDLTDANRRERLRQHLSGCPECRGHFKRLKGMFRVLEQAEEQRTYDSADSLWPNLRSRLGQPRPRLQGPRFNGWVPFSVMAAACVLLMIVMETQPTADTVIYSGMARGVLDAGIHISPDPDPHPPEIEPRDQTVRPRPADEFGSAGRGVVMPVDDRHSSSSF